MPKIKPEPPPEEIVVGLDVGTTKICAIVGSRNEHGKIDILGQGSAVSDGVNLGEVQNIDKTVIAIQKAVKAAEDSAQVDIGVVHVGIAGQHINSLQHRYSILRMSNTVEISREEVDDMIESMYRLPMETGSEIIHVLPQEFRVDHITGIKDPVGMSGVHLDADFHVITGKIASASMLTRCVRRAGLEVSDLILESIASAESVLHDDEREAGVALVDIGGGTTDIAIFKDNIIRHSASIPLGGNIITQDIHVGCAIMSAQAERLKVQFGSALAKEVRDNEIVVVPNLQGRDPKEISTRNLASIIQSRVEEMVEHVRYAIRLSGFERQLIGGIVLTGGGSQMRHIRPLFEYMTGLDVRLGCPGEHLAAGNERVANAHYATGVGLVMLGLQDFARNGRAREGDQSLSSRVKRGSFFDNFIRRAGHWMEDQFNDKPNKRNPNKKNRSNDFNNN